MIIDDVYVALDKIGKDLGFEVNVDFEEDFLETTATITFRDGNKIFLTVVIVFGEKVENIINIYDRQGKNLYTDKVRGDKTDISLYDNLMKATKKLLEKKEKYLLNTAERVYDYGEENNWQGITNKQYEILSQDASLARMAVADMQDKGIVVPEILQKFRRYSMSFREMVESEIAKEQRTKQQINRVAKVNKKAAEDEELDVKLKIQKNKPAGLDTSSPKSLPESIRPLMTDLKDKITTLKETEAELANTKAGLDAQYQKAKDESKIVEKQAEIENLTTNIGKLLFAAKNETFQFQDNLVALTHQVKTVPAKATDKWKFEKVFAKLEELMGKDNAQKFLDNTLNGLQSQATEKTITELNIFSPTQKQLKKSDTSDTNKFIDALKEIYVNLRNYYLDVKKANNIIEEQLATGTAASKTNKMNKKALQYWDGKGSKETAEEETNEYDVSVKVVFNGTVYCKATSQDEANNIVVNNFRCLLGKCEDNLEDGSITDWDMDVHGETELDEENVVASKKQFVTKKANWFDLEDPKNLTYFNLKNIIRYYQTIIADMKEIDAEKMKNAAQELVKVLEKFKGYSDYEEEEEDTEIESKKKIK